MTTFTALKWHLPVPKILGAWRLLSSPNPGDELLESLHLGAAELFPRADFLDSSPQLSVESSVNKANKAIPRPYHSGSFEHANRYRRFRLRRVGRGRLPRRPRP